ncbi:hydrogenase accessory protein HypB [Pyrolobus fumarii 1A]|uniref:Hydrogenase accessory protein HypB n=1 Tax=Pyrolobus fumarii (strain DSM 11204 / 1A) TaxID=694429 RepID=G0ED05_PYRF1|nr:hydrogenase nickel incorporation protein HypB [Pyrolobus fumarii]AEM38564.1 hydrogenase accessory protein HypB [Pyrolobus fumarii 1A]
MSIILAEKSIREENLRLANELAAFLRAKGIRAFEFLGSPGSGKTSVIECLIKSMLGDGLDPHSIAYIGGDVATRRDTERVERLGVQAVQINTGGICHLEVPHIKKALGHIDLDKIRILLIENVGNLICPFYFPLGAEKRVLIVSVAEGDDKFVKHPVSTRLADVIVINKIDLADAVGADVSFMEKTARELNPRAPIIRMVAKSCEGVEELRKALGL